MTGVGSSVLHTGDNNAVTGYYSHFRDEETEGSELAIGGAEIRSQHVTLPESIACVLNHCTTRRRHMVLNNVL